MIPGVQVPIEERYFRKNTSLLYSRIEYFYSTTNFVGQIELHFSSRDLEQSPPNTRLGILRQYACPVSARPEPGYCYG